MNRGVRVWSPRVSFALCALVIATGALAPAALAAERLQCELLRPVGSFVTGSPESPCPPLPSGILSEGESDELAFWRLSKSLESSASSALFANGIRVTRCGWTATGHALWRTTDHGCSLVDQAVRLQI